MSRGIRAIEFFSILPICYDLRRMKNLIKLI